jgi:ubiquitin-protein ligase
MAANRLNRELQDLKSENSSYFRDLVVNDTNLLEWKFSILPTKAPFNVASFVIEMKFPGNHSIYS